MNIKILDSAIDRSIVQQSMEQNTVTDAPPTKPASQLGVASSLDRFEEPSLENYMHSALKLASADNQNDVRGMKERLEEVKQSQSDRKMFVAHSGVEPSKFDYVAMSQKPNLPAPPERPIDEALVNRHAEQSAFERMRSVFGNILQKLSQVGDRITSSIK
jgi:hypothetical protein